MPRFNLICNGMMLFRNTGDGYVDIVIPPADGHVRRIGFIDPPTQQNLVDLPTGKYDLLLPPGETGTLHQRMSPSMYLVLRSDKVEYDQAAAERISAIVRVPMPPLVRFFRASEPAIDVFGDGSGSTPEEAAFARPRVHHDVVVFSYPCLKAGTKVAIRPVERANFTLKKEDAHFNVMLYSTEEKRLSKKTPRHPTSLNQILKVNGQPTHFTLSGIGKKDAGHPTQVGMTARHMAAFFELPRTQHDTSRKRSGELGCSGAVLE
jgi:hypothetical protein